MENMDNTMKQLQQKDMAEVAKYKQDQVPCMMLMGAHHQMRQYRRARKIQSGRMDSQEHRQKMHEERSDRISAWKILVNTVRKTLEIRRKNSNQVRVHNTNTHKIISYFIISQNTLILKELDSEISSTRTDLTTQLS